MQVTLIPVQPQLENITSIRHDGQGWSLYDDNGQGFLGYAETPEGQVFDVVQLQSGWHWLIEAPIKLDIECKAMSNYTQSRIYPADTDDLEEVVELNALDSSDAVAGSIMKYLLLSGRLELSINGNPVDDVDEFLEESDWMYQFGVMDK